MTQLTIKTVVHCPMLSEYQDSDLVDTSQCQTCPKMKWRYANAIDCIAGEERQP